VVGGEREAERREVLKEVAGDALSERIVRLRFSVHRDITRLID
jgi:hypothetical protein